MARLFPFCCAVILLFSVASFAHAGGSTRSAAAPELNEETCSGTKVVFECYNCRTGEKYGSWEIEGRYNPTGKSCAPRRKMLAAMCQNQHGLKYPYDIGVKYWWDIQGWRWNQTYFDGSKVGNCPVIGR